MVKRGQWIHVALIIVVAMWGLVFVGIARLLPYLDPVQLVVIRFTLIALVFVGIFVVRPSTRPSVHGWRDWGTFVVLGILAVPGAQLTIVNGQHYLAPPLVSLVVTTSPAFAAIIAALWLKERITTRQTIGFITALVGVTIVIVAGVGEGTEFTVDNPWGAATTVLSPMCWATYTILSKMLTKRFDPVSAVGLAMVTGSLSMAPLYPHAIAGIGEITATGWLWMGYLIVGGTVVPYLVWWNALNRLTAATTTAYMYGIPFAALIWSWLVLGIVPSIVALFGGVVVIVGVTMIQYARREVIATSHVPGEVPA